MKTSLLEKCRELAAFPPEVTAKNHREDPSRSSYERFALPYSFKPRLSLGEALIAAFGALLRIFFGSLLFAVWGTYSFLAWSTVQNVFLRGAVLVVLLALFAVAMTALMLTISAGVRMAWPHREDPLKASPRS